MYKERIWSFLLARIENEYGVAGLMGNLQAESGLIPNNVENERGWTDEDYTSQVDSGVYSESEFVHDRIGYGLAQWTFSSRKQRFYDMYKEGNYSSISDIDLQLNLLWYELENDSDFKDVLTTLRTASSIREASDKVLHDFENPTDQSESVEIYRESLCISIYEELVGTPPDLPDIPEELDTFIKKRFNFILFNQQRKRVIHYGKGRFTRQTKRDRHMRR